MNVLTEKAERGRTAYHAGLAAEGRIERAYLDRGATVTHRRWRGRGGEIDLILHDGEEVVFVEVKKSRSFAAAAERIRPGQMQRIHASAEEYLGREPLGQLTPSRFDVALVNGQGEYRILENAFGHD